MKKILYLKSVSERNDREIFKLPMEKAEKENMDLRIIFLSDENRKHSIANNILDGKQFSFYFTLSILEREIANYNPDYIALHLGVSFEFSPTDILQSLAVIKIKYPKIEIICEPNAAFDKYPRHFFMRNVHSSDYNERRLALKFLLIGENEIFNLNQRVANILWN